MVKVSFNSALAQKDVKKDAESLIPEEKDAEAVLVRSRCRSWRWCYFLSSALILSGCIMAGVYLCTYINPKREEPVYWCGTAYVEEQYRIQELDDLERQEELQAEMAEMEDEMEANLKMLEETIQIFEEEQVELINVPVPEFEERDPANIVHDFQRMLTAYLDLTLDKCYIIPLNASTVMPPRNLMELLQSVKTGKYLPQTYLVHEEMVVTDRIDDVEELGSFIGKLCRDKDTFKLQRRDHLTGIQKREVLNCRSIRHFENTFVVETLICEA